METTLKFYNDISEILCHTTESFTTQISCSAILGIVFFTCGPCLYLAYQKLPVWILKGITYYSSKRNMAKNIESQTEKILDEVVNEFEEILDYDKFKEEFFEKAIDMKRTMLSEPKKYKLRSKKLNKND